MPTATRARLCVALFASLAAGGCAEPDLRLRVEAAGVFAPQRTEAFRQANIDLGQALFFDPELSGTRDVACASCHLPSHHASDQLDRGRGVGATGVGRDRSGGAALPRHTLAPFNRSFAQALLWDGRVALAADGSIEAPVPLPEGIETLLEAQALLPLLDRSEMRGADGSQDVFGAANELGALPDDASTQVWDAVMARLLAIEEYRTLFHQAFPSVALGEHTIVHAARAIAQFEMRLWELSDTDFDRFLGSQHRPPLPAALQGDALAGAELFFGDAGCDRCHDGPLLGGDGFHNIGVPPSPPPPGETLDEGRARVTGEAADRFAFRTPPLRNVRLTAPYFHNGAASSLDEVFDQHIDPGARLATRSDPELAADVARTLSDDVAPLRPLSAAERDQLLAFLDALTSDVERFGLPPNAGEPSRVPSGLPVPTAGFH